MIDDVVLNIAAGFLSTADMIYVTLYELAKNPEFQDAAYKEIRQIEEEDGIIDEHNIQKVLFLRHLWYEVLRVYPPIPFSTRKVDHPTHIHGHSIPAPHYLMYFKLAVGHNENIFSNPEKVDPERYKGFRRQDVLKMFGPFGFGPRNCIGQKLAELITIVFLVSVVKQFKFGLPEQNFLDMEALVGLIPSAKVLSVEERK